jgi:hypothetical protein
MAEFLRNRRFFGRRPDRVAVRRHDLIANMPITRSDAHAGDAFAGIRTALEARLQEIKDHEALSKSTDGTF